MARWMIENGSDVHQGGDGPLMRAALDDMRIPMMELLVAHGADVNALWNGNYPIICAPCETLAPQALKWLFDHGADPHVTTQDYGSPLEMLICTYSRNAKGKNACLEVFADAGFIYLTHRPWRSIAAGLICLRPTWSTTRRCWSTASSRVRSFPLSWGFNRAWACT